jgi:hypothetical protein
MRRIHALLAVALLAASGVPLAAAAPAQKAKAAAPALMPAAHRQAVALMTAGRVERGLAALPQTSPQQAVASLRSVAKAYTGMARVCREAGWAPMAGYYTETAAVFSGMVSGKLTRAQVDTKTRALEMRRRQLTKAAIAKFGPANVSPKDPRLNAIADRLASRVLRDAGA